MTSFETNNGTNDFYLFEIEQTEDAAIPAVATYHRAEPEGLNASERWHQEIGGGPGRETTTTEMPSPRIPQPPHKRRTIGHVRDVEAHDWAYDMTPAPDLRTPDERQRARVAAREAVEAAHALNADLVMATERPGQAAAILRARKERQARGA